jgi:hypothetical protein
MQIHRHTDRHFKKKGIFSAMHRPRPPYTAWILLLLPLVAAIVLHFHPVLRHPDTTFLSQGDDALKNYYTPWYHSRHDSSWLWFEGMNYPYGDHLVFADAQPLVSNTIRAAAYVAPSLPDHTVGILNLLMLAQILVAGYCMWRILLRWGLEAHWAAGSAAAITLLAPQLLRMTGHFALSYSFFLPLLWLLLLRAQERPGYLREGLVGLCLFLAAWVHPYYLMIGAVFLGTMQGLAWLGRLDRRPVLAQAKTFALQVLLPGLLFFAILRLTDPVTDRPASPNGMDEYIATWRSVFLPLANPTFDEWTRPFTNHRDRSWEGIAYIGLGGTLGLLLLLPGTAGRFWRHRGQGMRTALRRSLPSRHLGISLAVIAALLLLAFAMGFPFAIKPERLTALFPPIKQFRSLGRFAWLFYELWMAYLCYALYRLHRLWRRPRPVLAYLLPIAVLASIYAEGLGQLQSVRLRATETPPAMAAGQSLPWLDQLDPAQYSALVGLPWFHAGGENLYTLGPSHADLPFAASLRTGLPLLNVMMSRTSVGQTWDQFQLATEPAQPLGLLTHLRDRRPLLAIRQAFRDTFDGAYLRYLGTNPAPTTPTRPGQPHVYALDLFAAQQALLHPDSLRPADSSLAPARFRASFEQDGDAAGIYGSRGKRLLRSANNVLFEGSFPDAPPASTYTISLWARIRADLLPLTGFGVEVHDAQGNNTLWSYATLNNFVVRIAGDWALCERQVTLAAPTDRLSVNITRWSRVPPSIDIDELSIRRADTPDLHHLPDGRPLRNNRLVAAPAGTASRLP